MDQRMTAMEVALATLSATLTTKLDTLILAVNNQHLDHEGRVRALENRPVPDPTHEVRIKTLESEADETLGPRVSKLEEAKWILTGAALAAGGAAGSVVQLLGR